MRVARFGSNRVARAAGALVPLLLLLGSGRAWASTVFHGAVVPGGGGNQVPFTSPDETSNSPVSVQVSATNPAVGSISGAADASYGHVGALAFATSFNGEANAHAQSSFSDDNLIFHAADPSAFPSGVPITLNLVVTGTASVNGQQASQANVDFSVRINGTEVGNLHRVEFYIAALNSCTSTMTTTPKDSPFNGVTQQITVPLDTPVSLSMVLDASAGVTTGGATTPTANADYLHSFDFPQGTDLFNLPAGVTVNEPDAFVVNNRFVPAPEPSGLMAIGFAAFGMLRRRRASGM
jgi:hypothetical protein